MAFIPLTGLKKSPPEVLNNKPEVCRGCPAYTEPGPVWADENKEQLRLIIVGEAPGYDEVSKGIPFIGTSGQLLWTMLSRVGIRREQCYITNTAKCITKSEGAFAYCHQNYLAGELQRFPSTPILALGNEAKRALQPELSGFGILAARGSKSGRIICALHPAFIRRSVRFAAQDDKQDLTPTLMHDAAEAVGHDLPAEIRYIEGPPQPPFSSDFTSCDLETEGFESAFGSITQIGWGYGRGQAVREPYTESHRSQYQAALEGEVTFHNMLFDVPFLRNKGYRVPNPHCSMIAAHLLTPDFPLGLEFQNSLYSHYHPWKKLSRVNMAKYHATDLDTTWQLWDRQVPLLKQKGLWSNYINEVRPVTLKCCEMKQKGIHVDRDKMMKLNIGLGMKVNQIDETLSKVAPGVDFNSPKQVGTYLYDVLGLPEKLHPKTKNRTTDADALEELAEESNHPVLRLLQARRAYEKMRTTYTQYSLDNNDYFHHDISFTAATGRARGFLLTMQRGAMRSLFIPDEPDWEFLYADWSQIELWISAVCSRDQRMLAILGQMSLHAYAAGEFFGGPRNKTNEHYHESKFITHGKNFGRSDEAISSAHEIPLPKVRDFSNWLFNTFPDWKRWRDDQYRLAYHDGYITNEFGFTRHFWSGNIKGMAYSFRPQSTPAHMMKRTILSLWDELPAPARIVLPVHDALLVAYPSYMRESVSAVVEDHMTQPWKELGGWRAKVEIGYGKNWQEASGD